MLAVEKQKNYRGQRHNRHGQGNDEQPLRSSAGRGFDVVDGDRARVGLTLQAQFIRQHHLQSGRNLTYILIGSNVPCDLCSPVHDLALAGWSAIDQQLRGSHFPRISVRKIDLSNNRQEGGLRFGRICPSLDRLPVDYRARRGRNHFHIGRTQLNRILAGGRENLSAALNFNRDVPLTRGRGVGAVGHLKLLTAANKLLEHRF